MGPSTLPTGRGLAPASSARSGVLACKWWPALTATTGTATCCSGSSSSSSSTSSSEGCSSPWQQSASLLLLWLWRLCRRSKAAAALGLLSYQHASCALIGGCISPLPAFTQPSLGYAAAARDQSFIRHSIINTTCTEEAARGPHWGRNLGMILQTAIAPHAGQIAWVCVGLVLLCERGTG